MIPPDRAPEGIEGTWQAVTVAGQPVIVGHEPTATFRGTEVSGTTGCNAYGGSYTYEDGKITIGELRMTLMACIGPIGDVEGRFTRAMSGATTATTDASGRLMLDRPGGPIAFIGIRT